jgi:hypothetical protein
MQFDKCYSNLVFNELLKYDINLILCEDIIKYIIYPYINYTPLGLGIEMHIDSNFDKYTTTKKRYIITERPFLDKPWKWIINPLTDYNKFNDVTIIGNSAAIAGKFIKKMKIGWSRRGYFTELSNEVTEMFKQEFINKKENLDSIEEIKIISLIQLFNGDNFIFDNKIKNINDCPSSKYFYILYEDQIENPNIRVDICVSYRWKERDDYNCFKYEFEKLFSCDPVYFEPLELLPQLLPHVQ